MIEEGKNDVIVETMLANFLKFHCRRYQDSICPIEYLIYAIHLYCYLLPFTHLREVPRILTIFDIDMPAKEVKGKVKSMFLDNAYIRDERVLDMLVEKGYMELESTLLQHKQRPHLLSLLDGDSISYTGANRKKLSPNATPQEMFARH